MAQSEFDRRQALALEAILKAYGTDDAEHSVNLFVSHHISELEADYWSKHLGTTTPEPEQILKLLITRPLDQEVSGLDLLDFTLPGEVTDYLLCVEFDVSGKVASIEMES